MAALSTCLLFLLSLVLTVRGYLQIYPPVNESDTRTPLYFALLQSFGGQYNGSGAVAGLQVALDRINSDPTLLPGYSLHYALTDSQCNRTLALFALFDQIIPGPNKIAVIGSGCSVATEPTAEVSHFYNITQISCASSSSELADRVRFRYYFQMLPTDVDLAPTYFGVIQQYGWRRVGLIVQNENLFTVTMDRLKQMLDTINVTYNETNFETKDGIAGLGPEPFDPNIRIHIIATYSSHARSLLCEAHRRGILYPHHVLLTLGWYGDKWWRGGENQNLACTPEERESALNNSLSFIQCDFIEDLNMTTDSGINGEQYFAEEQDHLGVPPLYIEQSDYAQYCYDATWTLVYALNQTISELEENSALNSKVWEAAGLGGNGTFPLDHFSYNNSALVNVIFRNLEKTNFTGVTGPVLFNDMGTRAVNRLRMLQYRGEPNDLSSKDVALVVEREEGYAFQYFPGESNHTVWPGGEAPYDGVPTEEVVSVDLSLTVIFSVLATAGIVFGVACLVFNFIFRNKTLIRLGSPNLNYLIGIGAIILYMATYFFIIPTTNMQAVIALCNITPWLTALGYSFCYGTILAKMVRVYYIFDKPTPQQKMKIKDWQLALGVLTLVLADITILLVYTVVEGIQGNLTVDLIPNKEKPMSVDGEFGLITMYFTYICSSKARDIFLGILYGYKMILQVIALVLAFSIRKVKVKGLDDAKYIAAAIYVTSIVFAVIIVSAYTLREFTNLFPALFCTGFLIGTTSILGLVFVPKMVGLYRDPEGKMVFSKTDPSQANMPPTSDQCTIDSLKRRVQELENEIGSSTSPSKLRTLSVASNTHENGNLGGEEELAKEESKEESKEGFKEGFKEEVVSDTPNDSTPC